MKLLLPNFNCLLTIIAFMLLTLLLLARVKRVS